MEPIFLSDSPPPIDTKEFEDRKEADGDEFVVDYEYDEPREPRPESPPSLQLSVGVEESPSEGQEDVSQLDVEELVEEVVSTSPKPQQDDTPSPESPLSDEVVDDAPLSSSPPPLPLHIVDPEPDHGDNDEGVAAEQSEISFFEADFSQFKDDLATVNAVAAPEPPVIVEQHQKSTLDDLEDFDDFQDFSSAVAQEPARPSSVEKPLESSFGDGDEDDEDFGDFSEFQQTVTFQETSPNEQVSSTHLLEQLKSHLGSICGDDISSEQEILAKDSTDLVRMVDNSSLYQRLRDFESSRALSYRYQNSTASTLLMESLGIDPKNALLGMKWNSSMPRYAATLSFDPIQPQPLKPTPIDHHQPLPAPSTSSTATLPNASQTATSVPVAQFDWSSAGLQNPLEVSQAHTLLLDLDAVMAKIDKIKLDYSSTCYNLPPDVLDSCSAVNLDALQREKPIPSTITNYPYCSSSPTPPPPSHSFPANNNIALSTTPLPSLPHHGGGFARLNHHQHLNHYSMMVNNSPSETADADQKSEKPSIVCAFEANPEKAPPLTDSLDFDIPTTISVGPCPSTSLSAATAAGLSYPLGANVRTIKLPDTHLFTPVKGNATIAQAVIDHQIAMVTDPSTPPSSLATEEIPRVKEYRDVEYQAPRPIEPFQFASAGGLLEPMKVMPDLLQSAQIKPKTPPMAANHHSNNHQPHFAMKTSSFPTFGTSPTDSSSNDQNEDDFSDFQTATPLPPLEPLKPKPADPLTLSPVHLMKTAASTPSTWIGKNNSALGTVDEDEMARIEAFVRSKMAVDSKSASASPAPPPLVAKSAPDDDEWSDFVSVLGGSTSSQTPKTQTALPSSNHDDEWSDFVFTISTSKASSTSAPPSTMNGIGRQMAPTLPELAFAAPKTVLNIPKAPFGRK